MVLLMHVPGLLHLSLCRKQVTANGSPTVLLVTARQSKDMLSVLMEGTDCVDTPENAEQRS